MNSYLEEEFRKIMVILYYLRESPEWLKHCEKANTSLTETDENYSINEVTFASIERDINFFLAQTQPKQ